MAVSKEMTPWFSATKQKPGRVGVYRVGSALNVHENYAYWNGRHWMATSSTVFSAEKSSWKSEFMKSSFSTWRGFTNEQ